MGRAQLLLFISNAVAGLASALKLKLTIFNEADRKFIEKIHTHLSNLVFWPDGIEASLERIARGDYSQSLTDELSFKLRSTQDAAYNASRFVQSQRDKIVRILGPGIALQIAEIVDLKMGTEQLRYQIRNIATRPSPKEARKIIKQISEFNRLVKALGKLQK